jgi:hypothetical protein
MASMTDHAPDIVVVASASDHAHDNVGDITHGVEIAPYVYHVDDIDLLLLPVNPSRPQTNTLSLHYKAPKRKM